MRLFTQKTTWALGGLGVLIVGAALLISMLSMNNAPPAGTGTVASGAEAANANIASDWRSLPFTNVRTNQSMTLADFTGKTVVVEVISVWCANCLYQQQQAAQALTKLDPATTAYISLDMDIAHPDDNAQTVVDYIADQDFPWTFAISNKAFTRAMINQFGYNVLNAPITPIFVISPTGVASDLYTGNRSAGELMDMFKAGSDA